MKMNGNMFDWHACGRSVMETKGTIFRKPHPLQLVYEVLQYASNLHGNTPFICIAVSLEQREALQYISHLYCRKSPICTAVRLPFVRQCFYESTRGWGVRMSPQKWRDLAADICRKHRLPSARFTAHALVPHKDMVGQGLISKWSSETGAGRMQEGQRGRGNFLHSLHLSNWLPVLQSLSLSLSIPSISLSLYLSISLSLYLSLSFFLSFSLSLSIPPILFSLLF